MKNLRTIRLKKHITQVRLSVEIDVAQETVSAYESGKALPSAETLCKMADFFNVSTDFLLDRTNISKVITDKTINEPDTKDLEIVSLLKNLKSEQKAKLIGYIYGLLE